MLKHTAIASAVAASMFGAHVHAATVSGKVTDTSGKAIVGAEVKVEGSRKVAFTNEQGVYQITGVDLDDVHIHVYSPQYIHGDKDLGAVTADTTVDFSLAPASIENVLVTANALQTSVLESVTPVSVISAETLRNRQAPTLGETIKYTPGVHSTYFGPVASSPIIRGNDGPRVKIVQNGLDVSDVSRIGPDHNVAVSTSNAVQVEVLRGPATLQYGSGAIGGVVNVVDNRISQYVPESVEGEAELRYSTVNDERFGKVDVTAGSGNVAFHFDGFARKTDEADIPGFASVEPDEDEPEGILENSQMETTNFNAGLSYVGDRGFVGFSVEQLDNEYGVPGHDHHHEEEEEHDDEHEGEEEHGEEEGVLLDVDMTRYQLAGELFSPFKGFSALKFSAAYTDYEHVELEEGEVGTRFSNEATDLRFSAHHESVGGWHGVIGVQANTSEYDAVGEEAFTPAVDTDSYAVFLIEQKNVGDFTIELGARLEQTEYSAADTEIDSVFEGGEEHHEDEEHEDEHDDEHGEEHLDFAFPDYDFTALSLSAGVNWEYDEGRSIAVSVSHSERAPSQQELFSAGQHLATQTYDLGLVYDLDEDGEIGEGLVDVKEEVSTNIDVTFRKYTGNWGYSFGIFYNQVDDYIYASDTGLIALEEGHEHEDEEHEDEMHEDEMDHADEHGHEEEEGFTVLYFRQADADLYGFEMETFIDVSPEWRVTVFSDYIRAKLDNEDLPRIPPLRVGATVNYDADQWSGELGAIWYDEQGNVSSFETQTDGYTLVNARVQYEMTIDQTDMVFFLQGENLTDEEARVHTSFLKDQAPLPGRNITLGVRAIF